MQRTRIKIKTGRYCACGCGQFFEKKFGLQKYIDWEHEKSHKGAAKSSQRKPIKKVSDKQKKLNAQYLKINHEFLSLPENKICPVTGGYTTEVHHKKGRKGFADDWARLNNIPLISDVRFFLAVSRAGHKQIEENPNWAKENGYSLSRLEVIKNG